MINIFKEIDKLKVVKIIFWSTFWMGNLFVVGMTILMLLGKLSSIALAVDVFLDFLVITSILELLVKNENIWVLPGLFFVSIFDFFVLIIVVVFKKTFEKALSLKVVQNIFWLVFWGINVIALADFTYALSLDALDLIQNNGGMKDDFLEGFGVEYYDSNTVGVIKLLYMPIMGINAILFRYANIICTSYKKPVFMVAIFSIMYCFLDFIASFF